MKKSSLLKRLFKNKISDNEETYQALNLEEKDMIRGIVELSDTTLKRLWYRGSTWYTSPSIRGSKICSIF